MLSSPASSTYAATDGAAYDRFIGRWSRRLADAVAPRAEPLPEGSLLDVGCGTGSMALALAGRYAEREVVGIDVAEPYLDYAAQRPGGTAIRFMREDACAMSFADASFAAAYGLLLLNFVPEPLRAVREMRRVTSRGGAVLAAGWD